MDLAPIPWSCPFQWPGEASAIGPGLSVAEDSSSKVGAVGWGPIAPLLARLPVPPHWRYVVAVPSAGRGLSGEDEARAFEQLPAPPEGDAERVAHLVLMQLLPP